MSEIKKPQSPAERAKEFAADNGFIIEPVGRRYRITRNNMHNVTIAEVGGYPAALNAMKTQVRADELAMCTEFESKPVEICAGGTLVLPEPSADPALTATANNRFGTLEPVTPDTVPMSREEMFAPVKEELNRLYGGAQTLAIHDPANWAHKTADEIKADIVAGVAMLTQQSRDYNDLEYGTGTTLDAVAKRMGRDERAAGMSDREYRNLLIYGDSRVKLDYEPIVPQRGETGYLVDPSRRWYACAVVGASDYNDRFASRADAVTWVRRLYALNGKNVKCAEIGYDAD